MYSMYASYRRTWTSRNVYCMLVYRPGAQNRAADCLQVASAVWRKCRFSEGAWVGGSAKYSTESSLSEGLHCGMCGMSRTYCPESASEKRMSQNSKVLTCKAPASLCCQKLTFLCLMARSRRIEIVGPWTLAHLVNPPPTRRETARSCCLQTESIKNLHRWSKGTQDHTGKSGSCEEALSC